MIHPTPFNRGQQTSLPDHIFQLGLWNGIRESQPLEAMLGRLLVRKRKTDQLKFAESSAHKGDAERNSRSYRDCRFRRRGSHAIGLEA